jgi:hypothetical protein
LITFDEFTFSLPRLWIAACLVCVLDLFLVSWLLTGVPQVGVLLAWLPRNVARATFLYGPFVFAGLWLVVAIMGAVFHRWRGLWLLLTALLILPATYLHWGSVWNCAIDGQCL